MRKALVTILMILAAFVLQTTVFSYLNFGGIVPNLLILVTASTGIMRGEKDGLLTGFFCGLLVDIFFGQFLGMYSLIYMYIGYVDGKFNRIFYPENILFPIGVILGSDLAYGFICYILFFLMRTRFDIGYYSMSIIIPEVVYTAVCTIFLYPVILRINTRLDEILQRSAKKFV